MPLFMRKRAITAKIETTYGTDSTPAAATDGVSLRSLDVVPLDLGYAERGSVRSFFGNFQQLPTTKVVKVDLEMEVAGFGAAGPATPQPGYAALLRACALSQTISAGTKVDYKPISAAQESATIYYYHDGRIHKVLGARGEVALMFKRNEIPVYKFSMIGLDGGIADGALVAPTLTGFQQPLTFNKLNSGPFTVHGVATTALESLELKLGNSNVYRNLVNSTEQILHTDRKSEGSLEIEDTLVAIKDWWATVKAATLAALDLTHGTAAGNIVQLTASNMQLIEPKLSDSDGIAHLALGLRFLPSTAGNDEFTLTIK